MHDFCSEILAVGGIMWCRNGFRQGKRRMPVTLAERSKACTVFARSEAAIMGSNPTQGMDV
jgi:hypothetical protein